MKIQLKLNCGHSEGEVYEISHLLKSKKIKYRLKCVVCGKFTTKKFKDGTQTL